MNSQNNFYGGEKNRRYVQQNFQQPQQYQQPQQPQKYQQPQRYQHSQKQPKKIEVMKNTINRRLNDFMFNPLLLERNVSQEGITIPDTRLGLPISTTNFSKTNSNKVQTESYNNFPKQDILKNKTISDYTALARDTNILSKQKKVIIQNRNLSSKKKVYDNSNFYIDELD